MPSWLSEDEALLLFLPATAIKKFFPYGLGWTLATFSRPQLAINLERNPMNPNYAYYQQLIEGNVI